MDPNEEDVCFVMDRFVVDVSMKADDFKWLVPNQTFVRHVTNISVTFRATETSDDSVFKL